MPRYSTSPRKRVAIPAVPSETTEEKREKEYLRLGVSESEVKLAPRISGILASLEGGVDKAIEFLRGSNEPDAKKWLGVWDGATRAAQDLLPFEAFCVAANLTTKRVLEIITGACFEQSDQAAALIAKAAKPKIVQATVDSALIVGKEGTQDRKMLHLHEGFVPVPKTNVLNVSGGQVNVGNQIQAISLGELGGIENKTARIMDRFNERRRVRDGEKEDGEEGETVDVVPEAEPSPELPPEPPPEPSPEWEWDV